MTPLTERNNASDKVYQALKRGELVRPKHCTDCGKESDRIVGHHADYSQPLKVEWLCRPCHGSRHTGRKPSMRKNATSIRISPEALKILRRESKKMGLSQAGVIETLLREKAARGSLRVDGQESQK